MNLSWSPSKSVVVGSYTNRVPSFAVKAVIHDG